MASESVPPAPRPDVLGGFGKLREAQAALRNLEHLLGSVQVGPKVLAHVLPELELSSASWKEEAETLIGYCASVLSSSTELLGFQRHFVELLRDFARALGPSGAPTMTAKVRLALERDVRRLVPAIGAAIDHLELLVEATWARGLPLSLKELLLSRPDIGSERPYRTVRVVGDAESVEVTLPARVALRAVGALVGQAGPDVGLSVRPGPTSCILVLERGLTGGVTAQLPIMVGISDTSAVVRSALLRYGVSVSDDALTLELPSQPMH